MGLTIKASESLAQLTKSWNPAEARSFEVLRYQYAVTLNFVSYMGLALLGGLITGHPLETMVAAVAFTLLRVFSGGFHFRSLDVCAVVTAVIFITIPLIPINIASVPIITGVAAAIVSLTAPTNLQNTSWADDARLPFIKRMYKVIATIIVLTNFIVGSEVAALAFVVQAALLIPRKEVKPL